MTRTYESAYFNPVGFTRYRGVLILTNAGASRFSPSFVAEPTTDAVLEFLDVGADAWRDNWTVSLGGILPAVSSLALRKDGSGLRSGALASQTFAAAYFVDLSGLNESPVDPSKLRLLRTVELSPGGATNTGTGYQPGLALSPDGTLVYVSSFNAASEHALADAIQIELVGVDTRRCGDLGRREVDDRIGVEVDVQDFLDQPFRDPVFVGFGEGCRRPWTPTHDDRVTRIAGRAVWRLQGPGRSPDACRRQSDGDRDGE